MDNPVNKKRYRYPDTDKRRAYMRDYMKRYRAGKKDDALGHDPGRHNAPEGPGEGFGEASPADPEVSG